MNLHPKRAVRFYQGKARGNWVPALVWLYLVLIALLVVRNRAIPSQGQVATLAVGAGVVVAVGTVAPEVVTVLLLALLIASALNLGGLGGILTTIQARIAALTMPGG